MKRPPIVIVTGRSGSGKSTALAAFEDSGFYCVDNMPIALLPVFLEQAPDRADAFSDLAFGMDLREKNFIDQVEPTLDKLKTERFTFRILFLEADERTLLKRYSQTRRYHPYGRGKNLVEGIQKEKQALMGLRSSADQIIDITERTRL